MMIINFTILPLFLVIYVRTASAIKCFQCNSQSNSACIDMETYDHPNTLDVVDCVNVDYPDMDANYFCRKITQEIILPYGYKPELRITRGCGFVSHKEDCYKKSSSDHTETVCQCFSDYCNSAPKHIGILAFTLPIIIALVNCLF